MCPATRVCGTRRGRTPRRHAVSNTRGCAGDGAGLGPGQHPPVRRRPRPGHHQRPVRRQLRLHLPPRVAARQVGARPRPGVSPPALCRGLFRRAILQSGAGGFSPSYHHFSAARAHKYGQLAALELGCLKLTSAATAECLREQSVIR